MERHGDGRGHGGRSRGHAHEKGTGCGRCRSGFRGEQQGSESVRGGEESAVFHTSVLSLTHVTHSLSRL